MEGLGKKLSNLGLHDIRNAARFAQNMIVQYEPYQIDIRRATNTDSWGPTPKHLQKIMRHRFQIPMYLLTEYILKRLVDHMATRPKNIYEKARKQYVNYGNEWRVVLKCLIVLEFLLLNVDTAQELDQMKNCLKQHKVIFTKQIPGFKIEFSQDGKMEIHERGILKKNEVILQYLDDPSFLKQERLKTKKNSMKMMQSMKSTSGLPGTATSASSSSNNNSPYGQRDVYGSYDDSDLENYNNNSSNSNDYGGDYNEDDDEDDDETNSNGKYPDTEDYYINNSNIPTFQNDPNARKPTRQRSIVDEQRRQRRENLKEQIKLSEQKRKQQEQQSNEPLVDLLDFDSPVTTNTSTTTTTATTTATTTTTPAPAPVNTAQTQENNVWAQDDDDFGDFQSDSPHTTTTGTATTSTATTTQKKPDDMFADLLSFSKTNF